MTKTECIQNELEFQDANGKRVVARFDGGTITTDTGLLLLREIEKKARIIDRFTECFSDHRDPTKIRYQVRNLVKQRVFAICQGYEDLNDHDTLRHDPLFGLVCERTDPDDETGCYTSGKSTLNRLECGRELIDENERYKKIRYDEKMAADLLLDASLDTVQETPDEIVLDFDNTDDPLHGDQEGRFFHGYYDCFCYLPLYVFWGERLLAAQLRTANADGSEDAEYELERIVTAIRKRWPDVRIMFRADSGFCRERIMGWCEKNGVFFLIGLAKNRRLERITEREMNLAKAEFTRTLKAQRVYKDFRYRTKTSWTRTRRVVGKAEYLFGGANPRYVVTNLPADEYPAQDLYEVMYCGRGNMENRIKEQHLGLFADRTSSHTMHANQLRLYFSSLAYILMNELRRVGLRGTEYENAQCSTIRLKFLKVGARITTSVRRICISIATGFPYRHIYFAIMKRIGQYRLRFT